jgi:hypothetical protein
MDDELRKRLEALLRPLYQEVDGVSRFDEIERIARIARTLHTPGDPAAFELLLLFHGLSKWLERVGSITRVALAVPGISEEALRETAASIRRLNAPISEDERAVAGAALIDRAGVHGLALRLSQARREGHSVLDVVREALADSWIPDWMPESGRGLLEQRLEARRRVCSEILEELDFVSR